MSGQHRATLTADASTPRPAPKTADRRPPTPTTGTTPPPTPSRERQPGTAPAATTPPTTTEQRPPGATIDDTTLTATVELRPSGATTDDTSASAMAPTEQRRPGATADLTTPMAPTTGRERQARVTAEELAALTPPDRDRVVDFVRVAAVGVVVVGHWLLAAVTWGPDGLEGRNLLGVVGWTHWLTWAFQVMPLVFLAGGAANAASWASAQRRDQPYGPWLQGRLRRLVRPAAVLVALWTAGLAAAHAAGADDQVLVAAARLVAMPLWFLAVYVPVVAVTPLSLAAHRRWGPRPLFVLATLVAATDVAVAHGATWLGWSSFAWAWLLTHHLGFHWRDAHLPATRSAAVAMATAVGGTAALVALTTVGGYPVSMVGVPGERTNTSPPSLALVALAVAHFGILSLLRPRLDRWLQRPRVWRRVVAANGMVMTAYLWHMTALAAGVIVLLPTGAFPQPAPGSALWWAWRPVWIAALAVVLVPLLALFSRLESPAPAAGRSGRLPRPDRRWLPARAPSTPFAAASAAVLSAALVHLSLTGLPVP